MKINVRRSLIAASLAVLAVAALAMPAFANHYWGSYHWARTSNPLYMKLGDNVTSNWDSYLSVAASDWSKSAVIENSIVAGQSNNRCAATTGRTEVCNNTYGFNGWLGLASIWASGSHITAATVKVNDSYFNTSTYNTPAWRQMVMCQEVGHVYGLGHQDENNTNANLGTCMDYTNSPSTNQHPNQHDYDLLSSIYAHLDSSNTAFSVPAAEAAEDFNNPAAWGRSMWKSPDGSQETFERDFGNGIRLITHVTWALESHRGDHHE